MQTSRRRRSSARALSEELGSQAAVDAPHHAIHAQVKTFGVFNEKKGSGKKKGLALPAAPSIPNPLAAPPAPAPAPAPAPTKGKGRAAPPPPPPPPARKSDGPELDSSTKVEAELLGAAPFAVLPVLGLVGARGALTQGKKQREAEQQARIAAARAQELTPLQQKAVFGLPAVAAASLAGLFAVGPVTDALKPAPPVKGKKASTSAKGPSLSLPKLGGLELPKSKSKADPSEARAAAQAKAAAKKEKAAALKEAAAKAKQDAADAKAAKIAERKAAKADASASKAEATAASADAAGSADAPKADDAAVKADEAAATADKAAAVAEEKVAADAAAKAKEAEARAAASEQKAKSAEAKEQAKQAAAQKV